MTNQEYEKSILYKLDSDEKLNKYLDFQLEFQRSSGHASLLINIDNLTEWAIYFNHIKTNELDGSFISDIMTSDFCRAIRHRCRRSKIQCVHTIEGLGDHLYELYPDLVKNIDFQNERNIFLHGVIKHLKTIQECVAVDDKIWTLNNDVFVKNDLFYNINRKFYNSYLKYSYENKEDFKYNSELDIWHYKDPDIEYDEEGHEIHEYQDYFYVGDDIHYVRYRNGVVTSREIFTSLNELKNESN